MLIFCHVLRGNAIKVSNNQFPDIHNILINQSTKLGLKKVPDLYILQHGGLLNAFATQFIGNNYIVIYSDILEEAYSNNIDTIEFIIGHELGHLKRKHMTKSILLFPSLIIPFLGSAYSRACEYTCDNIGYSLNSKGATSGLLVLASGKKLWKKVNLETYIKQDNTQYEFWPWFAEKVSSHPNITKRIKRFAIDKNYKMEIIKENSTNDEKIISDHSAYLPK